VKLAALVRAARAIGGRLFAESAERQESELVQFQQRQHFKHVDQRQAELLERATRIAVAISSSGRMADAPACVALARELEDEVLDAEPCTWPPTYSGRPPKGISEEDLCQPSGT
jgi:hypothetical protein